MSDKPKGIDPLQDPLRPGYFMNYAEHETEAEMVLRKLACWLGVGGYSAPKVDAKTFHSKIVDGVNMAIESEAKRRCADLERQLAEAREKALEDAAVCCIELFEAHQIADVIRQLKGQSA